MDPKDVISSRPPSSFSMAVAQPITLSLLWQLSSLFTLCGSDGNEMYDRKDHSA